MELLSFAGLSWVRLFNFGGINHLFSASAQNSAGKAAFLPHSLSREKHACKGIASGLKKISTPRYASGSIFLAALASTAATLRCCAPAHSATLR
jgi:hypothetical protein